LYVRDNYATEEFGQYAGGDARHAADGGGEEGGEGERGGVGGVGVEDDEWSRHTLAAASGERGERGEGGARESDTGGKERDGESASGERGEGGGRREGGERGNMSSAESSRRRVTCQRYYGEQVEVWEGGGRGRAGGRDTEVDFDGRAHLQTLIEEAGAYGISAHQIVLE
jgi:hypothetical protein